MDKKILLVDDASFMRMLIKNTLTQNGYTNILEAADGEQACQTYEAEKPDLVVATGDIAFPVPYMAGTFNNYSGAKAFENLMESLGVYWTVTFGNHDAEEKVS